MSKVDAALLVVVALFGMAALGMLILVGMLVIWRSKHIAPV